MSKFKPWDAGFRNVDPKLIRTVEGKLEDVYYSLHGTGHLTETESARLELEERTLVRALENLYEDRHPQFRSDKGYDKDNKGEYIDPHEDE